MQPMLRDTGLTFRLACLAMTHGARPRRPSPSSVLAVPGGWRARPQILRRRRAERGALQLASPEVKFTIDTETHDPLDVGMYQVGGRDARPIGRGHLPLVGGRDARPIGRGHVPHVGGARAPQLITGSWNALNWAFNRWVSCHDSTGMQRVSRNRLALL